MQTNKRTRQENFDILKYDGIRARNMGKLPYAIKCFEEAVALQEEKETLGFTGQCISSGPTARRMHVSPLTG